MPCFRENIFVMNLLIALHHKLHRTILVFFWNLRDEKNHMHHVIKKRHQRLKGKHLRHWQVVNVRTFRIITLQCPYISVKRHIEMQSKGSICELFCRIECINWTFNMKNYLRLH